MRSHIKIRSLCPVCLAVADSLYSAGLGVRCQTIIGPVRVEYGHNLNPRPLNPSGTLLVSIGFPF